MTTTPVAWDRLDIIAITPERLSERIEDGGRFTWGEVTEADALSVVEPDFDWLADKDESNEVLDEAGVMPYDITTVTRTEDGEWAITGIPSLAAERRGEGSGTVISAGTVMLVWGVGA